MAGIEKICEYSGEYAGWEMYVFKRNNIQVLPKYRKVFKGQDFHFYYSKSVGVPYEHIRNMYDHDGTLRDSRIYYEYFLYTPNMERKLWWNYSYDIRAVRHHLTRMLKTSKYNFEKNQTYISNPDLLYLKYLELK